MTPELENVLVDVMFMEQVMTEDDGGHVQFSVKELLAGLRMDIKDVSIKLDDRPTKADLEHLERTLRIDAGLLAGRVERLEQAEVANQLRWAKVAGLATVLGAAFGGGAAALVKAIFG